MNVCQGELGSFRKKRCPRFVGKISTDVLPSTNVFLLALPLMSPTRRLSLTLYNARFSPICHINPRFPRDRDPHIRSILKIQQSVTTKASVAIHAISWTYCRTIC
jgi:hypothetical protein